MKKKKTSKLLKFSEEARRRSEIEAYGKLVSLRPSKVIESKKTYKRKKYKYNEDKESF